MSERKPSDELPPVYAASLWLAEQGYADEQIAAVLRVDAESVPNLLALARRKRERALDEATPSATGTSDPNDSDSGGVGIWEGRDVEWIQRAGPAPHIGLPASNGAGHRQTMKNLLDQVEAAVAADDTDKALSTLAELRSHVDGCGKKADKDDWIVNCNDQVEIRRLIDVLIANLSG